VFLAYIYTDILLTFSIKPDGYLTDERKAAEPDQGFSTFFSETGTHVNPAIRPLN
jgi:hypothetical protein